LELAMTPVPTAPRIREATPKLEDCPCGITPPHQPSVHELLGPFLDGITVRWTGRVIRR
jgi:hypothetical protein